MRSLFGMIIKFNGCQFFIYGHFGLSHLGVLRSCVPDEINWDLIWWIAKTWKRLAHQYLVPTMGRSRDQEPVMATRVTWSRDMFPLTALWHYWLFVRKADWLAMDSQHKGPVIRTLMVSVLLVIEYLYFVIADNYRKAYKNNKNTELLKSLKYVHIVR